MQGEDDLIGLAKIMAFMKAVSIIIVLMHLYWFCYGFFLERGYAPKTGVCKDGVRQQPVL